MNLRFVQPMFAGDGKTAVPRVKICGITNEQDALDAIELGADALGFNTYVGSKRHVDLKKEARWMQSLPPEVTKVAVMVNASLEEAEEVSNLPFIDMVQFHGDENEEFCALFARLGKPFIKAIAVKDGSVLTNWHRFQTRLVLLDAYIPGGYGGTGRTIDLDLLRSMNFDNGLQLILAGGLDSLNVREAIDAVHPHAVDVASGVESAPGRKERVLMEKFIRAARKGDR